MSTHIITAHGMRFAVECHGFAALHAESDRDAGLAVIADELQEWPRGATMTSDALDYIAELGRAAAMADWYRPNGNEAGFTISVASR